jgi:cysteinyl-tRNA synthetase
MISLELVMLIRQLLQPLQRNVWYAINITDIFNPTLNRAIQLNIQHFTSLMLATGIMVQRGSNIGISLDHLEFLKASLQENMTIFITWSVIHNKNHY